MVFPKISLITPSFNQGQYIEQTIISVLSQNYPNLEYIIIDGNSQDNSVDIIKKYEKYLSYWISEPDLGQTHAINKGIAKATGDIFYWLNADDYLEPFSLQLIADEFSNNTIDVLCVKSRFFDDLTNKTIAISQVNFYKQLEKTIVNSGMGAAIFYKLNKVKNLEKINESLHYAMDFDLWFKYLFANGTDKIKYSSSGVIVNFRLHPGSKSISQQDKFILDTNAIHYSILKQANAPFLLMNRYDNPRNNEFHALWNFSSANIQLLLAYYAQKLSISYYTVHQYSDCKKCLQFSYKNGLMLNLHSLVTYLKLIVIPTYVLNFIRKIKNI